MSESETPLSVLNQKRQEAEEKAARESEEAIARHKAKVLSYHLTGRGGSGTPRPGSRTAPGGTPVGCVEPDTLSDAERAAIVESLGHVRKVADVDGPGTQDSVDVVVEYLRDNDAAREDFLRRCGAADEDEEE